MPVYSVRYLSGNGRPVTRQVEADNEQEARLHDSVARSRITSVRRYWKDRLRISPVDLNEQRLLLCQMSMQLSHGSLDVNEIEQMIERLPSLRRNRQRQRQPTLDGLAPHELLRHLNLHPYAVTLCREGERIGQVPALLLQAAEFLEQQRSIQQRLQAPLIKAGLFVGVTLGLFVVTPFLFQMLMERLSDRLEIKTTVSTEILFGIHALFTHYLPLSLIGLAAAIGSGFYFWAQVRRLPLLRDLDRLILSRRSYVFLSVLAPAFRKGINLAEFVQSLNAILNRRTREYLYNRLRTGHRLSKILSDRHFSLTLVLGLNRFEDLPETQLPHLFHIVQTSLHAELDWCVNRVVQWARWTYSGLAFLLLSLLVNGFLLPIYSVSVR